MGMERRSSRTPQDNKCVPPSPLQATAGADPPMQNAPARGTIYSNIYFARGADTDPEGAA